MKANTPGLSLSSYLAEKNSIKTVYAWETTVRLRSMLKRFGAYNLGVGGLRPIVIPWLFNVLGLLLSSFFIVKMSDTLYLYSYRVSTA